MKGFVLRENLRIFQDRLTRDLCAQERSFLHAQLAGVRRELAILNAASDGTQCFPAEFGRLDPVSLALLRDAVDQSTRPTMIIDPRAGLHIVDLNDAYQLCTLTRREQVAGEGLFDVFPDNPDVADADGVANLFDSIQIATRTRSTHAMPIQRYDVRNADGRFVTRYWQPENIPILDEQGKVAFILHQADDVTLRLAA